MAPWKNILLKSVGVGIGIGIGLGISMAVFAWYSSRPIPKKPWDQSAMIATFEYVETRGEDHHLIFLYTLENRSDNDYKTDTDILQVSGLVAPKNSLAGDGGVRFEEHGIFLPAKQRALVRLEA